MTKDQPQLATRGPGGHQAAEFTLPTPLELANNRLPVE
jgi:hypothetical protein